MPRLTREQSRAETRRRVLDAAARVFTERGFAGASLEEIADRAGFSRGAVYSNFADKSELFLAVLDDRAARRVDQVGALLRDHASPGAFFAALRTTNATRRDEVREWTILSMEFWLYAMRHPEVRPRLAEHDRVMREALGSGIATVLDAVGATPPAPLEDLAVIVQALDDGVLLQHLLDPDAVREDLYMSALELLVRATAALSRETAGAAASTRRSQAGRGRRRSVTPPV